MLRRQVYFLISLLFFALGPGPGAGAETQRQVTPEEKTARYFESVRHQPSLLLEFLTHMPKGADLHNHLSGAVYAESFLQWAVQDGLCVDRTTSTLLPPPCDADKGKVPAATAYKDTGLYAQLMDAFSMRGWRPGLESGHDHFFATFGKFGAASGNHTAEMLAEVRSRAASEHLGYLELMFNPDGGEAARLGARLGWNDDFTKMREQMLSGGLSDIVARARQSLNEIEAKENAALHCGEAQANAGCNVQARYLYQVARGLPREQVFAQILAGFEIASQDARVVGLNLVMPEDWYIPIHDFQRHMDILSFLHELYPKVHITLHAGELTSQLVAPEEMFHIRASIERAHAERIGHGVDIMREPDATGLLREMAKRKILVEICLTSNDIILGVSGARHPLPVYMRFGVPVALATDDAGVSRSSMTQEYQRAAETYDLGYKELKKMARNSLVYSFLPGEGIWKDSAGFVRGAACAADDPAARKNSAACSKLLAASDKARAEWELEKAFAQFEAQF